uniref:uncharacterized protein LOC120338751 n=1 Tax=Styela clava TaxID=7725 RepID=UPI00193A8387|nr:uncharacterized protein LOC120338751 [Styela clava]
MMNYDAADAFCKKHDMVVANIKDKEGYDALVKAIRAKIPEGEFNVYIWIGTTVDLKTGKTTPQNVFTKWKIAFPIKYDDPWLSSFSNVILVVDADLDTSTGMRDWHSRVNGVLCQMSN